MNPFRYLRVLLSALFPPKRRIVRLVRPYWHTRDFMLLECGHRIAVGDYEEARAKTTRCDRCLR